MCILRKLSLAYISEKQTKLAHSSRNSACGGARKAATTRPCPSQPLIQHKVAERQGASLPRERLARRSRGQETRRQAAELQRVGSARREDSSCCGDEIKAGYFGGVHFDGPSISIHNAHPRASYSHAVSIHHVADDGIGRQADAQAVDQALHVEQEHGQRIKRRASNLTGRSDVLAGW